MIVLLLAVFPPPPAAPPASAAPPPSPAAGPAPGVTKDDFDRFRAVMEARLDAQDETIEGLREKNKALQKALDEERKRMDLTFALSAGALITANLTSNVGPGVWLGGEGRFGPVSLGLEVRGVLPSPVFLGPYDFDVSQLVAHLVPCIHRAGLTACPPDYTEHTPMTELGTDVPVTLCCQKSPVPS